ncbi:zinc finger, CCHC-type containing protein [Tanacetum coccineum]|uniref:Zinc finger, CCHC-type containing protein n=1 Tax=Tanacetum coccineum TaxID=301880 RepID=A0ABQ5GAY4_9ASTR
MVEVKVLMALANDNDAVSKEGTRNGEWIKTSMRNVHTLLEMEDNDDRKNYLDYLSQGFWGKAMLTACYLLNRIPNKRNKITPYELWTKRKPNLNNLRVWGYRVVVRLPDPKLKTFDERGIECIFAGYVEHSKAFRPSLRIPNGTEDIGGSVVPKEVTEEVVQQPEPELKKSKRNKTPKNFGPEFQLYLIKGIRNEVSDQHSHCFNVEDDPKTFDEAMKSLDQLKATTCSPNSLVETLAAEFHVKDNIPRTEAAEHMCLQIIPMICLEPADKEDEVVDFLMVNFFEKVLSMSMNKEEPPMVQFIPDNGAGDNEIKIGEQLAKVVVSCQASGQCHMELASVGISPHRTLLRRIGLGINRCWSVEDTNLVTFEKIKEQFGATVRHIVEGETKVLKLGKLKYKNESHSVQDVKAHDLRQMFLAMTEEVRVIIVKLADRLHNMRTLSHMDSLINKRRKADLIVINPSSWSMVPIHGCISSLVYCLRSENIDSVNSSDVSGNFTTTDGRKSFSKLIGSEIFQFGVLFAFHKDKAAKKKTAVAFAEVSLGSRQNLIYVDLSNLSFINGCDLGLKGKNVVDFIADELVKKQLSLVFLENVDMTDIVT